MKINNPLLQERFDRVGGSRVFKNILDKFNLGNKKVLDIGCSHGEYLVCFGKGSVGITTNNDEVEFGKENSINIIKGNAELLNELDLKDNNFETIWANNLFEHLLSPHMFLTNLKDISTEETILILGVPVIPKIVSLLKINKFKGTLADSHISFFTKDTLKLTVERAGWNVFEARGFVFKNRILDNLVACLSPHIFIVAKKDKNFKYSDKKIKEWKSDGYYNDLLNKYN